MKGRKKTRERRRERANEHVIVYTTKLVPLENSQICDIITCSISGHLFHHYNLLGILPNLFLPSPAGIQCVCVCVCVCVCDRKTESISQSTRVLCI